MLVHLNCEQERTLCDPVVSVVVSSCLLVPAKQDDNYDLHESKEKEREREMASAGMDLGDNVLADPWA